MTRPNKPLAQLENERFDSEGRVRVSPDLSSIEDYNITNIGSEGIPFKQESDGSTSVSIQDQVTNPIDIRFAQSISGPYLLDGDTDIDSYTIDVVDATDFTAGDQIGIFQDSDNPATLFARVISKSGNTLTLNIPTDISYSTDNNSAVIFILNNRMNVDGSTTRQIFSISNQSSSEIDITRVLFKIITTTQPDFAKFGDLTALTNGILLRKKNSDGTYYNIFNVRNNGEFVLLMYDVEFYDASKKGVYGLGGRFTFAGPSKHGVAVRLTQGEELQVVVQDDLQSLVDMKFIAEGHYCTVSGTTEDVNFIFQDGNNFIFQDGNNVIFN